MSQTATFLNTTDLHRCLLIGYYGGGNYGDELLLETLAHLLKANGTSDITVTYQKPGRYPAFHHEFGFRLIPMHDKKRFFGAYMRSKNIVIGGGGLWGLDVNFNIFLLSLLLFLARFVFRKNVYLLGVGYYDSTSRLGRVAAWLAGKGARRIIARDAETQRNFQKITNRVLLDRDLAWNIPDLALSDYQADLKKLERTIRPKKSTLFVTLRRFKPHQQNRYAELIGACLAAHPDVPVIVSLMEPKEVDPAGHTLLTTWAKNYPHVQIADFSYNPLALYLFFRKYHDKLALIGPQFHIIITAQLAGVPFLPIVYDNKVAELFSQRDVSGSIPIQDLTQADIDAFVESRGRA